MIEVRKTTKKEKVRHSDMAYVIDLGHTKQWFTEKALVELLDKMYDVVNKNGLLQRVSGSGGAAKRISMRKLTLNADEQILFYNFLTWACKEEPKNFTEWGEQYVLLTNLNYNLSKYVTNNELKCSENEAWAIQNYFACYVDEIHEKRLGEKLFNESRDLFVRINNDLWESQHNPFIFIKSNYEIKPQKKVYVNPSDSPERYLA